MHGGILKKGRFKFVQILIGGGGGRGMSNQDHLVSFVKASSGKIYL